MKKYYFHKSGNQKEKENTNPQTLMPEHKCEKWVICISTTRLKASNKVHLQAEKPSKCM